MGKARRDKAVMAALTRKVSAITAGRDTPTATRRRPQRIDATLKAAIRRDERSHYALAEAAGITSQQIGRFMLDDDDERHRGISLETAASLAVVLGLELRPCGT
jgi:hypothetical protein